LQPARGSASHAELVVLGEALKRKRIVRTAEVTIETQESVVLRGSSDRRSTLKWCPACRRQVEMVTPERAAQIAGVSPRTIYRWIEAGTIHSVEDCGHPLICRPALAFSQISAVARC